MFDGNADYNRDAQIRLWTGLVVFRKVFYVTCLLWDLGTLFFAKAPCLKHPKLPPGREGSLPMLWHFLVRRGAGYWPSFDFKAPSTQLNDLSPCVCIIWFCLHFLEWDGLNETVGQKLRDFSVDGNQMTLPNLLSRSFSIATFTNPPNSFLYCFYEKKFMV